MSGEYAEEQVLWEIGNFYQRDKKSRFAITAIIIALQVTFSSTVTFYRSLSKRKAVLLLELRKFIWPKTMGKNISPETRPDIQQSQAVRDLRPVGDFVLHDVREPTPQRP